MVLPNLLRSLGDAGDCGVVEVEGPEIRQSLRSVSARSSCAASTPCTEATCTPAGPDKRLSSTGNLRGVLTPTVVVSTTSAASRENVFMGNLGGLRGFASAGWTVQVVTIEDRVSRSTSTSSEGRVTSTSCSRMRFDVAANRQCTRVPSPCPPASTR